MVGASHWESVYICSIDDMFAGHHDRLLSYSCDRGEMNVGGVVEIGGWRRGAVVVRSATR